MHRAAICYLLTSRVIRVLGLSNAILILFSFASIASGSEDFVRHQELASTVLNRLLASIARPEGFDAWPPKLLIVDDGTPRSSVALEEVPWKCERKRVPIITVSSGEIERIAEFIPDRLAFTIGHELGHLALGHLRSSLEKCNAAASLREQEFDADLFAMKSLLKAGFSFSEALLSLSHPQRELLTAESQEEQHATVTWSDRVEHLHTSHRPLWRSMAAFEIGILLLQAEQFAGAEFLLEHVTKVFPDSYEALEALGYARIMQLPPYYDADDLRALGVNHLAPDGFYKLSLLYSIRAGFEDHWYEAVLALRQALQLKEDLILARATLALTYLLIPEPNNRGERDRAIFDEVTAELDKQTPRTRRLDPLAQVAILLNASTAYIGVSNERASELLSKAEGILARLAAKGLIDFESLPLANALKFNRAVLLAESENDEELREAVKLFECYLARMPMSLPWWTIGFDRYTLLCKQIGIAACSEDEFKREDLKHSRQFPPHLALRDGQTLSERESLQEVKELLGTAITVTPIISGTSLRLLHYPGHGLSIFGLGRIHAIFLGSEASPSVMFSGRDPKSKPREVHIGMSRNDFESTVGADLPLRRIASEQEEFYVYRELGLAVKFQKGKVSELVIFPILRGL